DSSHDCPPSVARGPADAPPWEVLLEPKSIAARIPGARHMNAIDLSATLAALKGRFRPGAVTRKTTYYLSLGETSGEKWTVTLSPTACEVAPGKIANADCVLKMSAALFVALVEGRFKPGAMDLLSGKIKTNDVDLLQRLQQSL